MLPVKMLCVKLLMPVIGGWGTLFAFAMLSFILSTIISWLNWFFIEKKLTRLIKLKLLERGRNEAAA